MQAGSAVVFLKKYLYAEPVANQMLFQVILPSNILGANRAGI